MRCDCLIIDDEKAGRVQNLSYYFVLREGTSNPSSAVRHPSMSA